MFFSRHLLVFTLLPLLIFSASFSYYRFVIKKDYRVGYDAMCDPSTQSCYVWCEDEECADPEYYVFIEKYASDVYAACGEDVTDCPSAHQCLPTDTECSIRFCDPTHETCAVAPTPPEALETEETLETTEETGDLLTEDQEQ